MTHQGILLYEGKAKQVFASENPDQCVLRFKDSATAFNNVKKAEIQGKGALNLKITTKIFQYLESKGVPTHFIKVLNEREMLTKKVAIIPLEVVLRNVTAGNLCKRLGIEENQIINPPLLEFYLKSDALNDPLLTEDHIRLLGLAADHELSEIKQKALQINTLMIDFFHQVGIRLVDFKIEFGRDTQGNLLLADEISPDGCRLWDEKTSKPIKK